MWVKTEKEGRARSGGIGVAAVVGVLLVLGLVFYSVSGLIIGVICSILFHPVILPRLLFSLLYLFCAGFLDYYSDPQG